MLARTISRNKQALQLTNLRYFASAAPPSKGAPMNPVNQMLYMDFPGGKVPFTPSLGFLGGPKSQHKPIPCYRVIDTTGSEVPDAAVPHPLDEATALKMYKTMVSLQAADTIFYEAQRQV